MIRMFITSRLFALLALLVIVLWGVAGLVGAISPVVSSIAIILAALFYGTVEYVFPIVATIIMIRRFERNRHLQRGREYANRTQERRTAAPGQAEDHRIRNEGD